MNTSGSPGRSAIIERTTTETQVKVEINIEGSGKTNINTTLQFIDHLITAIGKYSMMDITLTAKSVDGIMHHLVEDISITLSQTIDKALFDRSQITRFGYSMIPMDEAMAYASIDLVKRQFSNVQLKLTTHTIEGIPREDLEHFVRSLVQNLNACTHIIVEYGDNDHHKIESAMKAFAISFRMAASIDERMEGAPSTKGVM